MLYIVNIRKLEFHIKQDSVTGSDKLLRSLYEWFWMWYGWINSYSKLCELFYYSHTLHGILLYVEAMIVYCLKNWYNSNKIKPIINVKISLNVCLRIATFPIKVALLNNAMSVY